MGWFERWFGSRNGQDRLNAVEFDTKGLRVVHRDSRRCEWVDAEGDTIVAAIDPLDTTTPAVTSDAALIRAHYRSLMRPGVVGLVSVDAGCIQGMPTFQVLTKHHDPRSCPYEGTIVIPLRNATYTLSMRAREHGMTGVRVAPVQGHCLEHSVFRLEITPGAKTGRLVGWALDPYDAAHDDGALCSLADDHRWDGLFPADPGSKVRRWFREVSATATIDASARPDNPASADPSSWPGSRLRQVLPARVVGQLYLSVGWAAAAEAIISDEVQLEQREPVGCDEMLADTLSLLGYARQMQQKYVEAEWAFSRARRMFQQIAGDDDLRTARVSGHEGRMLLALKEFDAADSCIRRALPVLETKGNDVDVAIISNDVGLIKQARGDHEGAIVCFEAADRRFEAAEKAQGKPIGDRDIVRANILKSQRALSPSTQV